jgi:methylthioribose-1-phosphate isomerase
MASKEGSRNNKEIQSLRLDKAQIEALKSLEPAFGSSPNEVIRFIITDWINKNMGILWMKERGLLK